MTTEFNNHPLVDLEKLFLDDPLEILRLQQELEASGWCFVRLSQNARSFTTQINHITQSLSNFFSADNREKSIYLSANTFGYTRVNHKEGIKVLTNKQGNIDSQSILPMNINATLEHVSQLISDLTSRLKPIIMTLARSNHSASKQVEISDRSMLDIVHYFNEKIPSTKMPEVGYDTNEVNCVPHYDPGLFSLSILSTSDGLQLKDQRTNQWIDGPNNSRMDQSNIGVIWLGEAASILTENRLQAGIHRVVYPHVPHQARLTVWQEVCTDSQIKQLFERDSHAQHLPSGARVTLANQPNSKAMKVRPGGENRNDFMKRVESERGLSRSKIARRDLQIDRPSTPETDNIEPSFQTTNGRPSSSKHRGIFSNWRHRNTKD